VINRYVGNLPPMPGVFPDYPRDSRWVVRLGASRHTVAGAYSAKFLTTAGIASLNTEPAESGFMRFNVAREAVAPHAAPEDRNPIR